MLNWYANTFRISEKNVTKAGLFRTRIFAWLALIIVPVETIQLDWIENSESVFVQALFGITILAALVGLVGLLLSPLIHRFWARDKYLDEWEIEIKRKGMSAGYKVLFGAMFAGLAYSAITTDFSGKGEAAVSLSQLDSVGFALLILAFCVQTLTQLNLIQPMDEDDMDAEFPTQNPVIARIAVVLAIFTILFGSSFIQGFSDGWNDAGVAIEKIETGTEGVVK